MASKSTILSIDRIPDLVTKRCTKCRHPRPIGDFAPRPEGIARLQSWCGRCKSIHNHEYRHSERGKANLKEYQSRPEVKARRKKSRTRNASKIKATRQAWEQTPIGRACLRRKAARMRLKKVSDGPRRERLLAAIEAYTATIERIREKATRELEAELPQEPPKVLRPPMGRPELIGGRKPVLAPNKP